MKSLRSSILTGTVVCASDASDWTDWTDWIDSIDIERMDTDAMLATDCSDAAACCD